MATQSTVFLLGAGASNPYGFPLGSQLKQSLLQRVDQRDTRRRLSELGFEDQLVRDFVEILKYGTYSTIDEFLDVKTRFRKLGSYLIAEAILPHEKHEGLFPAKDWYKTLFDKLDLAGNPNVHEQVAFVTLNYDRSLEHFLEKAVEYNLRDEDMENAHKARIQLRIVHAHGSLGQCSELPYGDSKNVAAATIDKIAQSIKIVSDRMEDSPLFQEAKSCLAAAERIVFIGFGYHPLTLHALFDPSTLEGKTILGTAVHLSPERSAETSAFFNGKIALVNKKAQMLLADLQM